ncbi:MAG TPA: glycosyltransferase family 4 protein [Limnochordia bacterium]|nr:glycosyltransferase family 4 protein [Limnochordia bacterium]
MKIVWVVRPAEGGILQHLQRLLQGIPDLEIVVVAPPDLKEWAGQRRFISLDLVDGLRPKRDFAAISKLRRLLRQEKADVVHAHGLKAALVTSLALAPVSHPGFLFTAHNSLPQSSSTFTQWATDGVQRWMFGGMNTIISVSDTVRSQIVRFAPEAKVLTIHNGIASTHFGDYPFDATRTSLGFPLDCQIVGTVARLIPSKGVSTLLEAMSLMARIMPNLHLVIVGEGPERSKLEQYAHGLGLDDKVKFLGWRDDVPSLMAGWDCFALPSLSEGFNLSVLEAMASRLPVVVSDLPALREALVPGRSGQLVKPGSAPDLAAALLHVLKSPEKAKSMGDYNRHHVETYFGEDRMVRCTRALYEGLLT